MKAMRFEEDDACLVQKVRVFYRLRVSAAGISDACREPVRAAKVLEYPAISIETQDDCSLPPFFSAAAACLLFVLCLRDRGETESAACLM